MYFEKMRRSMKEPEVKQGWSIVKDLWQLVWPYRPQIKRALTWICVNELLNLIQPAIMMVLIDHVVNQSRKEQVDHAALLGMAGLALLAYSLFYLAVRFKNAWVFRVLNSIEFDVLAKSADKLLHMPPAYFAKENPGKVVGKLHRGVKESIETVWHLAFGLLPSLATLVITSVVLFAVRYQAGLAVLVILSVFIYTQSKLKHRIEPLRKELTDLQEDANAYASQAMDNIVTVQAFGQEQRELDRVLAFWENKKSLEAKEHRLTETWGQINRLTFDFGQVAVFVIAAYGLFSGALTLGQLFFVLMLAGRALGMAEVLNRSYKQILKSQEDIRRTLHILKHDWKYLAPAPEEPASIQTAQGLSLEACDVGYIYPVATLEGLALEKGSKPALSGVNLKIKAGSLTGIVGLSGSGKSTLLGLMRRLDDPDRGQILLDGIDVRDLDLAEVRRHVASVGQIELFNTSIAKNIAYGQPAATDDQIRKAAELANAHEFITELPKGYATVIDNKGSRLSEGQKQRICLARALLCRPAILLLDEPLNHLDAESAYQVKTAIDGLRGQCTIVHVTHQLWSIREADQIIMLDCGRVAEYGTHAYLMSKHGLYSTLYQRQILQQSEILGLVNSCGLN
ncbi:MAG: putative multidrug export ATP-binding/permease protein [Parcubacteria group bacterium ADurb.Bin192]|nr:MAG: putative multidrug export ATP-binding/permease protein [Parcubacteria group bacterium ADurb.Bin192]